MNLRPPGPQPERQTNDVPTHDQVVIDYSTARQGVQVLAVAEFGEVPAIIALELLGQR